MSCYHFNEMYLSKDLCQSYTTKGHIEYKTKVFDIVGQQLVYVKFWVFLVVCWCM